MSTDARLQDLLSQWQQRRAGGEVSLRDLCAECPELLPELERQASACRKMEALEAAARGVAPGAVLQKEMEAPHPSTEPGSGSLTESPGRGEPSTVDLQFLEPPRGADEVGWLGAYRIRELLGSGGMGLVLRGEDTTLKRDVAIKVMRQPVAVHAEARQRFLREARLMAAVEHERIVPIYHVGEAGGVPFFVMPLLKGETLAARLKREAPLPLDDQLRIAREVAEGLAVAHARGLIHRDIKPANIWLKAAGEGATEPADILLLDFGVARPEAGSEDLTAAGAVLGTPSYMAPEQAEGQPVDHRADLFSLGCVLYEMATGHRPFRGSTPFAILHHLVVDQPEPPRKLAPGTPIPVADLILRLLAKLPDDRPATAAEVARELRSLEKDLREKQVSTQKRSFAPSTDGAGGWQGMGRTIRGMARRRWVVGSICGILLAGLVLVLSSGRGVWRPDPVEPSGLVAVPSPAPPPGLATASTVAVKGRLDVLVYAPKDPNRQNRYLNELGVLPLRQGDELCIEVELNRPAYIYVLWIGTEGEIVPVYPWPLGKWERPKEEKPTQRLRRPDELNRFYRLPQRPAGMETLVLMTRETPLPRDVDLAEVMGEVPRQVTDSFGGMAWFENGRKMRGFAKSAWTIEEVKHDSPVLELQERIRTRLLEKYCSYTLSVSFGNSGK